MARDDFSKEVIKTVALRAGHLCSKCRTPTVGPHSDAGKALITGEACHVCAASSGGPRYDPSQSSEERTSIQNAIWLCRNCSKKLDTDWKRFPASMLLEWKDEHEAWIDAEGMTPRLPEIGITTLPGLTLDQVAGARVSAEDNRRLREQVLRIRNPNRVELTNFRCRLQLPEPVVESFGDRPAGVELQWAPDRPQMMVIGSGTVERKGQLRPWPIYICRASKLLPEGTVSIGFRTVESSDGTSFLPSFMRSPEDLKAVYHILGSFQYVLRDQYVTRDFVVPLEFDPTARTIKSLRCDDVDGSREIRVCTLGP